MYPFSISVFQGFGVGAIIGFGIYLLTSNTHASLVLGLGIALFCTFILVDLKLLNSNK
jgi:multisubunit Na+/H+ antiporter MnhC subunit